jgi:hypothetical protein
MKTKPPFHFTVQFHFDHEPESITITELDKILAHLKKISTKEYHFVFDSPTFMEITNDDGIEVEKAN